MTTDREADEIVIAVSLGVFERLQIAGFKLISPEGEDVMDRVVAFYRREQAAL